MGTEEMRYCTACGEKLITKFLENEGEIPYCPACEAFRFPTFSSAVSLIILSPDRKNVLLIQQYGKPHYVLVAGYIGKGEDAETAAIREAHEETGLTLTSLRYCKSRYFEPSNTLMLNFVCTADSINLRECDEVDKAQWFSIEDAVKHIKPNSLARYFLENAVQNGL